MIINQSINQWFICNSPNVQKHNIKFHGKKETISQSKQKAAKELLSVIESSSLLAYSKIVLFGAQVTNFDKTTFNFLYFLIVGR